MHAVLTSIVTEVCGLSRIIEVANEEDDQLEANGNKTVVLLKPEDSGIESFVNHPSFKRAFIVGNSGSGKSTIGNALIPDSDPFLISRGLTGTIKVKRADYGENSENGSLVVIALYDTPGLDDTNGLDVFYESCIKEYIVTEEQVSTFLMTVDVSNRLKDSDLRSFQQYKELFGEKFASMLLIVLTISYEASQSDLDETIDENWSFIHSFDSDIQKRNVHCVSLHDLRESSSRTASHQVVDQIRTKLREMPLVKTQMAKNRLDKLYRHVRQAHDVYKIQVDEMKRIGGLNFRKLTEEYEESGYCKLVTHKPFEGFVCQRLSVIGTLVAVATGRVFKDMNIIGRSVIEIICLKKEDTCLEAWYTFKSQHMDSRYDKNLLRLFSNFLRDEELAVSVVKRDAGIIKRRYCTYYQVTIIDPATRLHSQLKEHLDNVLVGKMEKLRTEIVQLMFEEDISRRNQLEDDFILVRRMIGKSFIN